MELMETSITEGKMVDEFIGSISDLINKNKKLEDDYKKLEDEYTKLEDDYKKIENDYTKLEIYNKILESKMYTIEDDLLRLNKTFYDTSMTIFFVTVLLAPCFAFYKYTK
jgi:hypothetical protein